MDSNHDLAEEFVAQEAQEGTPTTWYWRGRWHRWTGTHYEIVPQETIDHAVFKFLKSKPGTVKHSIIRNIIDLLRIMQLCHVEQAPCWINKNKPEPRQLFSTRSGLLHLHKSGKLKVLPHDPAFFWFSIANYDYVETAICDRWETFVGQLWPRDVGSIETLQEWFGYLLLPDTSQQKILSIIGPPRSGKSTIARVLTELLGRRNVAAPSIRSLSGSFGLWGLLDKSLAIIPDATLPSPCPALEELLKSISGEDAVDIQRKGMAPLTGIRLPTRLMLLANELPAFRDPSGALERRMIVLNTTQSFCRKEDIRLTEKLLEELPGILNWAIVGLNRLRRRGHFRDLSSVVVPEKILSVLPDRDRVRRIIIQYEHSNYTPRRQRTRRPRTRKNRN
jgi:putative DNA primase/helicase